MELLEQQVTTLQQGGRDNNQVLSPQEDNSAKTPSDTAVQNQRATVSSEAPAAPSSANSSIDALKLLLRLDDKAEVDALLQFALDDQPDLTKVLLAGLRTLKSEREGTPAAQSEEQLQWRPELWPTISVPNMVPVLPDPLACGIWLRRQSAMEVCYHNAKRIGLRFEDMKYPTCQSPWYSPLPAATSSVVALNSVPPDLYPTPAQRRYPHHPFMDVIPFPWLRERAITLASSSPPTYAWFELKADILNGGMVCWRSRGRDEGLPWDRRSWEVMPWFLEKWSWLIEEQGKVEQQSKWWRALRGQ